MPKNERPIDRRIIKTKRAIQNAFAKLLSEKDINDITVSDIAATADINRKTFYNYYAGIYEVVDEIENDVVRRFDEAVTEIDLRNNVNSPYMVFEKITDIINTDTEFFGYLMNMNYNVSLLTKLVSLLKDKTRSILVQYLDLPEDRMELMLEFTVTGIVAVYRSWFNSDRSRPIDSISADISELCFKGVNGFLDINVEEAVK